MTPTTEEQALRIVRLAARAFPEDLPSGIDELLVNMMRVAESEEPISKSVVETVLSHPRIWDAVEVGMIVLASAPKVEP